MAYAFKYSVFFAFSAIGLWVWLIFPGDIGAIPGSLLVLAGAILGHMVFKATATDDEIQEDLRSRADSID